MITLAVFDMAGTTVNDGGAVYRALQEAVEETGVAVSPEDLQTWMGTEKRAAITALIELGGGDPAVPHGKVDAAFERFRTILRDLYSAAPPSAIDGAPEAIASLRASGIKVALTTGFSRDVAAGILDRLGWTVESRDRSRTDGREEAGSRTAAGIGSGAATIDALVCGDEVAAGRPAPYMIHRAMERTGTLSVDGVLVAGDTLVDVRAGANAGAAVTVGVLTGKLGRADFAGQPHAVILDSVAEIPAHLATRGS